MMEVSSPPEYAKTTFLANGFSLGEQGVQNRFLDVQAIFRLIINNGSWRVDDTFADFQAAVCRQAVQEYGIGCGLCEERLIHLKSSEGSLARSGFIFLSHAGPDVCVDGLRSCDSLFRRAQDFNFAARLACDTLRFGDDGGIRLVAGGRRDSNVGSATRARRHQRVAHIITISHVRELEPAQFPETLFKREKIREGLAGMISIRKRIDHRNIRVQCQLIERFLFENARDDSLNPALEVLCDVADGFALAEARGRVIEKNGGAAE